MIKTCFERAKDLQKEVEIS